MVDEETKIAAQRLRAEGHGIRTIARALHVSRNAVRRILANVHGKEREKKQDPRIELIRNLYSECRGNLVRVREKLEEAQVAIPYSTLTRLCRRHGIGVRQKLPAGQYQFGPGEEMQHDTSPHDVVIGGVKRRMQCASVVLCFSRMMYIQIYPTFNRFYCKVFLNDAIAWFGGAAARCMVDNTNVVIAHGTGAHAVIAPEMKAFADRFSFAFQAHEKGDANRSARVERPFWFIERNFYPGREFTDIADLNRQAVAWCDKVKYRFMQSLHANPVELFQTEKPNLRPLPLHMPEIYELHDRVVDIEGYVNVHRNRYSAPAELIGRRVMVREYKQRILIYDGSKVIAEHPRLPELHQGRSTLPEHTRSELWKRMRHSEKPELPEETILLAAGGAIHDFAQQLRRDSSAYFTRRIRRLYRLYIDYPTPILDQSVATALHYGLTDLDRIEQMTLRCVAGDFFRLPREAIEGSEADE